MIACQIQYFYSLLFVFTTVHDAIVACASKLKLIVGLELCPFLKISKHSLKAFVAINLEDCYLSWRCLSFVKWNGRNLLQLNSDFFLCQQLF